MGRASRRRNKHSRRSNGSDHRTVTVDELDPKYRQGLALAEKFQIQEARDLFEQFAAQPSSSRLRALIENDLGTLDALAGELIKARNHFQRALTIDPECGPARQNMAVLERPGRDEAPAAGAISDIPSPIPVTETAVRVAIVSLLFNWPSTGGGTVHTAETGKFLRQGGYEVKHFYAQYPGWGVGNVTLPLAVPSEVLVFDAADWHASSIQRRFRAAIDAFAPDYVIITDSWNSKPLLAEAMRGYRYFLRLAAQECLCPLNNVRLLVDDQGRFSACPRNQLATADACRRCVAQRQHQSGSLHQAERELCGYGAAEYDEKLRRAFEDAEGVLVVNPLIAAAVGPYAKSVHVVPSGFDPERFPWPWPVEAAAERKTKSQIVFAGIVHEYMKGFHVLHGACAKLWAKRHDFELVATSDPPGQIDEMTRLIGWQSQDDLPKCLRQADFLVFPTIAEEALGRSAVEAMGVGRPVIASRIGGLPYTVTDGLTGLLFEPGDVDDLAAKIELLLDDPELRERLGTAARQRFVERFTWPVVVDREYRRLLKPIRRAPTVSLPPLLPTGQDRPTRSFERLLDETAALFGIPRAKVERMFETLQKMTAARPRTATGITDEQEFVLCILLSLTRTDTIAVVGSDPSQMVPQLRDMAMQVGLDSRIVTYDLSFGVASESTDEPVLSIEDLDPHKLEPKEPAVPGSFQADVLDRFGSGMIWLQDLYASRSEEIIAATSRYYGQWMIVMGSRTGDRDRSNLTALATQAGFRDREGILTNGTHRIVLASAAGLALMLPEHLFARPMRRAN